MCKYTKEKLIDVLNKITKRTDKRRINFVESNPLMANAAIDFVFSTRLELSIIYFCKQTLMIHYPESTAQQAREINLLVVDFAKKQGVSRSKARKLFMLDGTNEPPTKNEGNIIDIADHTKK